MKDLSRSEIRAFRGVSFIISKISKDSGSSKIKEKLNSKQREKV